MAFTASTCLTDLGGVILTDPIKFYSDVNNFLFEFGSANLSELTGVNCPYILKNIPDGTKVVKILSENNYCANVDVEKLDCNYFNFELITNNDVSRIKTANFSLKSSNVNLSDYSIAWYGPNNKNNLVFTSGKGGFIYDFNDPINQPVEGGTYYPVVQNVKLNGKTFSITGGTDKIYADLEDCLKPQVIEPCTCSNRTAQPADRYNHFYQYVAQSNVNPVPVSVSLTLTAGTKYIGWSFKGYTFPDRISIYFEGSAYPNKIGLDDWLIGGLVPTNSLNPTDFPKSASTPTQQFVSKVISLEKFTINNNDKITFNITPSNNQTDWDLKYTCLVDPFCSPCLFSQNNYKIPKSSITINYDSVKCASDIRFNVFNNCQQDNKYFDYVYNNNLFYGQLIPPPNSSFSFIQSLYFNRLNCDIKINGPQDFTSKECGNDINFKWDYNGSVNTFTFSGNSVDINYYYNQLITAISLNSGTTTTDNTQLDYYNIININIPPEPKDSCEKLTFTTVPIPLSSTITKSLDNKTLTIVPSILIYNPAVLSSLPPSVCSNCKDVLTGRTFGVNIFTTNPNYSKFNFTVNGRAKNIFYNFIGTNPQNVTFTSRTEQGFFYYTPAITDTIPFSGTNNTLIPSLSATTCQPVKCGPLNSNNTGNFTAWWYTAKLLNPSDPTAFKITTNLIQNCTATNNEIDIYISSGGTVSFDPNYII